MKKPSFDNYKKWIILVLTILLGVIVIVSIIFTIWSMINTFIINYENIDFQRAIFDLFGLLFLVLVGIEFLEILKMYTREHVVHVEVVLLVALIVAARKIIIIDITKTSSDILFGVSALIVAISASYYLIKKSIITATTTSSSDDEKKK
jgi:uncharacterized membrane protein (DUF373 family)